MHAWVCWGAHRTRPRRQFAVQAHARHPLSAGRSAPSTPPVVALGGDRVELAGKEGKEVGGEAGEGEDDEEG
jgi:hypothetical protein